MAKDTKNRHRGTVVEALPGAKFKVQLDTGIEIMSYLTSKMHLGNIRVGIGDKIEVIVSPDGRLGRIDWRY